MTQAALHPLCHNVSLPKSQFLYQPRARVSLMGIVLLPSVFLCDSVHKRVAKGGMASVTQKVFMYKHFSLQAIAGNCEVHKRGNKGSISLLHASHNAHRSTLPFCSVQVCSASGYLLCCSAFLQLVCAHLCSSSFSFNPNHQLTDISCFLSIFFKVC